MLSKRERCILTQSLIPGTGIIHPALVLYEYPEPVSELENDLLGTKFDDAGPTLQGIKPPTPFVVWPQVIFEDGPRIRIVEMNRD